MPALKRPQDYASRRKAELCFTSNIVIEAGAGMGKTTSLIKRLCYLILGEQIPPQSIVAVSFTEKASGEIKTKLVNALTKTQAALEQKNIDDEITLTVLDILSKKNPAKNEAEIKKILRKTLQEAFDNIERAQISTIHSFCLKILRAYPLEAGAAPSCEVTSDGARENLFDKYWASFLEEELAENAQNAALWKVLLQDFSLEDLKSFAYTLTSPFMETYRPDDNLDVLRPYFQDIAREALDLSSRYPILRGTNRKAESAMLQAHKDLLAAAQKTDEAALAQTISAQNAEEEITSLGACPTNWDKEDFERAKNIFELSQNLKSQKQILIQKAFGVLRSFAQAFKSTMSKENMLSYDDIIYKTKVLVERNKIVRSELKQTYRSFLIDEFQDTDPAQGEIMLMLCEKQNTFASSWRDIQFEEGKLCVVGDPKQSIYRFRGADICAYQQFTDNLLEKGAQKVEYTSNFRSTPQIIDFVNAFGAKAINEIKNVQPRYLPLKSEADFNGPLPQITAFAAPSQETENRTKARKADAKNGDENAEAFRQNQAQYIAKWIEQNVSKTTLNDGSKMRFKDIMILLRNQTYLNIYTDALKRFNIPYTVEETKNFFRAQEVLDLVNILQAVNDTRDKTALLGVLRSPFALLKDEDILMLSQNNALNIFAKTPPQIARAREIYAVLRELYEKAGRVSVQSLIKEIIFEKNFLSYSVLANPTAQTSANIFKFINLADEICSKGALTLNQFLFFLNKYAKEEEKEGESPLAEDNLDTVRLMTIHKAKGLEAPVVIAADLSAKSVQKNKPHFISGWQDKLLGARCGNLFDASYAFLNYANRQHRAAEELRLLYVALSRPREILLLSGNLDAPEGSPAANLARAACWPEEEDCKELSNGARAEVFCPQIANPQAFINVYSQGADANAKTPQIALWLEKRVSRKQVYTQAISRAKAPAPSETAFADADGSAAQSSAAPAPKSARGFMKNEEAKLLGLYCHEILLNKFSSARAFGGENKNENSFLFSPQPSGVDEQTAKTVSRQAAELCRAFFETEAYKTLRAMEFLYGELPFALKTKDGLTLKGIIDAVFKTKDGALLIADYKSDKTDTQSLDIYSQKYAEQLRIYRLALKALFKDKEIRTALIYLRAGQLYELNIND